MFKSKLDKVLCITSLHVIGFVFALRDGSDVYYPFAAVAILAFGMTVAPSADKEQK